MKGKVQIRKKERKKSYSRRPDIKLLFSSVNDISPVTENKRSDVGNRQRLHIATSGPLTVAFPPFLFFFQRMF